jgi:hypothetical protein
VGLSEVYRLSVDSPDHDFFNIVKTQELNKRIEFHNALYRYHLLKEEPQFYSEAAYNFYCWKATDIFVERWRIARLELTFLNTKQIHKYKSSTNNIYVVSTTKIV